VYSVEAPVPDPTITCGSEVMPAEPYLYVVVYVVGGCNNEEAGDKYELYFWNTATAGK